MRNIDLNSIYDQNNSESQELYSIAKMLFGDDFILVFDRYVFHHNESEGQLYDTNDNIDLDLKIESVVPLIIQQTDEIVAYLIITKQDLDIYRKNNKSKRQIFKDADDEIDLSMALKINENNFVNLILPNGEIIKYKVNIFGREYNEVLAYIKNYGLKFQDKIFQFVLVCTK